MPIGDDHVVISSFLKEWGAVTDHLKYFMVQKDNEVLKENDYERNETSKHFFYRQRSCAEF